MFMLLYLLIHILRFLCSAPLPIRTLCAVGAAHQLMSWWQM